MQSTRIIAFNVPPIPEPELRAHFAQAAPVTDLLVPQRGGRHRKICFVGYRTHADAVRAAEFFDNTFVRTARIKTELAKPIGDQSLRSNNSRQSSSAVERVIEIKPPPARSLAIPENGKIREVLALTGKKSVWGNDDAALADAIDPKRRNTTSGGPIAATATTGGDNDDDEYQDLPASGGAKTNAASSSDDDEEEQDAAADEDNSEDAESSSAQENATPAVESGNKSNDEHPEQSPTDIIAETGRLFVCNLTYSVTEDELKALFSAHGPVAEVHIPVSPITKEPRGYAFVLYIVPDNAIAAYNALNKQSFQGRILDIFPGREKRADADEAGESVKPGDPTYKKKKQEERRKNAAKATFSWNSLFMNSDTVASAISASLSITKSELLAKDANMAVRMALAETQIIQDTKAYLEEQGVNVDAFEKITRRSNRVILVKNLPYNTNVAELEDLFQRFGELGRVVFPPTRTIAIVELSHPNEAKSAFLRLAFSKFKHVPLYLEWCPEDVFAAPYDAATAREKRKRNAPEVETKQITNTDTDEPEQEDKSFTLFVKNVNFATTEARLLSFFKEYCFDVKSARIPTKKAKGDKVLSMGFGFVEFRDLDSAKQALAIMQGKVLENHALEIKFSAKKDAAAGGASSGGKAPSTKLLIRNVPFAATKHELRALISPLGQLKSLRLPNKASGGHRGFAFAEFLTKMDAKNVFDGLKGHFYGRHLVVEYAVEETLDEKRKKMKVVSGGAQRIDLDDGDDYDEEY